MDDDDDDDDLDSPHSLKTKTAEVPMPTPTPTRVAHPILRLDVVDDDGARTSHHRVYCRYQGRSVLVGTCCACVHCDAIVASPVPAVVCTITLGKEALLPDPRGVHTAVGQMLQRDALAIEPSMTMRDALVLLHTHDRRSVSVVDKTHKMIGVVHESMFFLAVSQEPHCDAAQMMSTALSIRENVPVRRALELLAAAHLREATVVDDDGVPLGVFRDVDGLHWLFVARGTGSS